MHNIVSSLPCLFTLKNPTAASSSSSSSSLSSLCCVIFKLYASISQSRGVMSDVCIRNKQHVYNNSHLLSLLWGRWSCLLPHCRARSSLLSYCLHNLLTTYRRPLTPPLCLGGGDADGEEYQRRSRPTLKRQVKGANITGCPSFRWALYSLSSVTL